MRLFTFYCLFYELSVFIVYYTGSGWGYRISSNNSRPSPPQVIYGIFDILESWFFVERHEG